MKRAHGSVLQRGFGDLSGTSFINFILYGIERETDFYYMRKTRGIFQS